MEIVRLKAEVTALRAALIQSGRAVGALLKIRLGIDDLSRDHEAELAALRAAREQDLRPVSDEEWPKTHDEYPRPSITRSVVNRLLARRRAAAPSVGYVADGPGPPADWPQCDVCGAVMSKEEQVWHCLSCGNSKPRAAAGEKETTR